MSDILKQLQEMSDRRHDYDIGYWWNAVDDAIDEIERLRGLLREVLDNYGLPVGWYWRVREALDNE